MTRFALGDHGVEARLGDRAMWLRVANGAALGILVGYAVFFATAGAHAGDAHAYWAADPGHPYTTGVNEQDAYLYAPPFVQVLAPLQLLPFELFFVAWTVLKLATLAWMVGPMVAVLVLLPGPYSPVWVDLWYGNIGILMAAALVLVFRWPGAWSFLLFTKVTPVVGLAWFVARRAWRYTVVAGAVAIAIAAISFVLAPAAWFDWVPLLASSSAEPELFPLPPLWLRLVAATAIAAVGGHFGARWTVPVAAVLAQPVFWFTGFSMFLAWVGLLHHRRWLRTGPER